MGNTQKIKLGNWFLDQLTVFQSANSDYQAVKENFIVRTQEFERIINSLSSKAEKDPHQHELILGRRGSGKSTLLKRIELELIENSALNNYIPINLAEEQAGIFRLFDLWEQVIYELKQRHNFNVNVPEFSGFKSVESYTRALYEIIHNCCISNNKKIVLLLDNFDRIVENFTDDGSLLREILINYADVQIIAGSTRMDEHFWSYDKPFYDFFRVHRLEALSKEEINQLLNHWGDTLVIPVLKDFVKNNPGKIENLRILTDGLPRTLQFFIQIVLQNSETGTYQYLKKTMDNVSPLFQERLNTLTAPFRKIIYEMAFIWESCSVKQLVEKTKMESKLISAHLKTLVDKGLVDKIETNKKQHLYRVSERFFNMWIIVTQGNPEQKRRAKFLSIFLENWYDKSDLRNLASDHIHKLKSRGIDYEEAIILSKALAQSRFISTKERDELIAYTENIKSNTNMLLELPEKFSILLEKIIDLVQSKDFENAIKLIESIENEEDGVKNYLLGNIYRDQGKSIESEKLYLQAISKGHVSSLNNLAILYKNQGKFEKSEEYYRKAIKKGHLNALTNLGILYQIQGKFEDSEKCYIEAIKKGNINALNNLSFLFYQCNKNREIALDYIKKATNHLKDYTFLETELIIEIWNGIFNNVENRAIEISKSGNDGLITDLLFDLLVQQQITVVLNLFNHPELGENLKEKFLLFYYATLLINKNLEENLELRIPPEINDTLNDVIDKIYSEQKKYGYLQ